MHETAAFSRSSWRTCRAWRFLELIIIYLRKAYAAALGSGPPHFTSQHATSNLIYRLRVPVWIAVLCALADVAVAQVVRDSLLSYDLSEIVIGGEVRQGARIQRVHRVGLSALARQDRPDIAGSLRLLPSASVQTNSRGETLVYIRAAGERQVAIFLDGAPLNIAWDNRIDLSLVPANILGSISIERGAVSAAYGPNVSGGAVNLQSRRLQADGKLSELTAQIGSNESWQTKAMFASRSGQTSILAGATLASTAGLSVSGDANLPFGQQGETRTNTDRQEGNIYVRLDRVQKFGSWGLTFLHAFAEKGVAPEGHLNPETENVRYWRYPVWRNTMAILNGVSEKGPFDLFATIWIARFQQEIDQYRDHTYEVIAQRQEDLDRTWGMRLVGERDLGPFTLRGIGFVTSSTHIQRDVDTEIGPDKSAGRLRYRSVLYSSGLEIASVSNDEGHWALGLTLDGLATPVTGDKPSISGFQALSANIEYITPLSQSVAFKLNAGSKPRFPTMRELFGTALNRFLPNPDLKAERAWIAESSLQILGESISFETTLFYQRTAHTIDQINVMDDNVRKRLRVNLDGSRVYGVEFVGRAALRERLSLDGHFTWMRPVAIVEDGNQHLMEKPEMLGTISVQVDGFRGTTLDATAIYTGKAYGKAEDNSEIELSTSLLLNIRLSGRKYFSPSGLFAEIFAGVDNVFDTLQLPQLGLPSAGRTSRIGINLSR